MCIRDSPPAHVPARRGRLAPPVSYTHLDVYKRQLHGWPVQRACPTARRAGRRHLANVPGGSWRPW
ncbi:hypothetical protein B1A87_014845 [Arthrobacter sp. KBS0703]|nr:hypothetical protein B1A87_014845 [Arthrobacter sp. KBS0703]